MRGAYYVTIALLVAVSSQPTAKSEEADLKRTINDDVAPSSIVSQNMSTRLLRGSRDLQDDLTISTADEERMLKLNEFGIVNNAEKLTKNIPKMGALSRLENQVAAVLRHKLKKEENSEVVVNAAKFLVDKYSSSSSSFPTGIAADVQHSKQGSTRKFDFLRDSLSADKFQESVKLKESDWLSLSLAGQSGHTDFLEKSHSAGQPPKSLKRKESDWLSLSLGGQTSHTDILEDSHSTGQLRKSLKGKESDSLGLALNGHSGHKPKRQKFKRLVSPNENALNLYKRFCMETKVPFDLNEDEWMMMLVRINKRFLTSPNNKRHGLETTVRDMSQSELKKRLDTKDLAVFLGKDWKTLSFDKASLQEAFTLKMVIMYELFYSFCHNSGSLCFDDKSTPEGFYETSWHDAKRINTFLPNFAHKPAPKIELASR